EEVDLTRSYTVGLWCPCESILKRKRPCCGGTPIVRPAGQGVVFGAVLLLIWGASWKYLQRSRQGGGCWMTRTAWGEDVQYRGGRMLTINEDLLGPEAIEDPYTYYGRLREEDPIHWNPLHETWVITRYDDVVWCLRHPELFSSEIFLRDARPPFPPILDTDLALYEFNKKYLSHWFIRRDTPDHLRMRRVVHPYFNPRYIEGRFRTLVREVIHDLLAEVEARGHMDVLQDFAAPLPVLVIAQWLGLPQQDRQFIRQL